MNCLHCGSPAVDETGYCRECGVNQRIAAKAFNTSNYYYNLGLDRARIRDLSGAEEVLLLSLKYNKANIHARNLLGLIYYETGEWVLALSHWVISTNYNPEKKNMAHAYVKYMQSNASRLEANGQLASKYNQALSHAASGSKDLAFMQLKKLISSNPRFVKGYLLLALLYIREEEFDRARKALKRVLKIDRFNPFAIRYLREIDIPEEYDDDDDMEVDYARELASEVQKPDLGDIIEGKDLDEKLEPASLQIGHYRDANIAKFTLVYVFVGLILGIVTMVFLIIPTRENAVRDEYKDIKLTFSDEIAKKNSQISDLESELVSANKIAEDLNKQLAAVKEADTGVTVYEKLFAAQELLDADKVEEAIWTLENITRDSFTIEAAKKMYTTIMEAGKGDIFDSIYDEGKQAYDDMDYAKAIKYLKIATGIDSTAVEAWYYLGKSYEASGEIEAAQKVKDYINNNFPDSQYAAGGGSGNRADDAGEGQDDPNADGGDGEGDNAGDGEGDNAGDGGGDNAGDGEEGNAGDGEGDNADEEE